MDYAVNIYFTKLNKNAIIPSKSVENAGYDIYPCFDADSFFIEPHRTKLVPTGIASCLDEKYYFQLFERGSTGSKGIALRCGVIDSSYRGEWFVALTNTNNNKNIIISKEEHTAMETGTDIYYPYSKAIAQAVLLPVYYSNVLTISKEEFDNFKSNRGIGCLGSSNK